MHQVRRKYTLWTGLQSKHLLPLSNLDRPSVHAFGLGANQRAKLDISIPPVHNLFTGAPVVTTAPL